MSESLFGKNRPSFEGKPIDVIDVQQAMRMGLERILEDACQVRVFPPTAVSFDMYKAYKKWLELDSKDRI